LNDLLSDNGSAYIAVSRRIPKEGRPDFVNRLQNYVSLTLSAVCHIPDKFKIYVMDKDEEFEDKTQEYEWGL
jgi:hypothetical protein